MTFEISCEHVWREVSNLLDGEIDAQLRRRMEAHFKKCSHCAAVLDGTRNVISLVGDDHVFEVPAGFSRRLQKRIQRDGHAVPNANVRIVGNPSLTDYGRIARNSPRKRRFARDQFFR